MPSKEQLVEAANWIRKQMRDRPTNLHPSFPARKALHEADVKFKLGSFGVEGWSNETGSGGVQYLNYGDPYEPTIVIRTSPHAASVHVAMNGWAPYA
jgi:hypothetical protein